MIVTGNSNVTSAGLAMRIFLLLGLFAGLAAFMAHAAHARGPGGFRGGGGMSMGRGGGGFAGLQRPSGARQRPNAAGSQRFGGQATRSGTFQSNRPTGANNSGIAGGTHNGNNSTLATRNGNTGVVGNGNSNAGAIGSGNGNTGVVGSGNVNTGNINNGNVAVGNDVNVNVGNSGWAGGYYGYPAGTGAAYATGVAVGTTATAAAIGSYYYTLPAGCSPYAWNSYSYYACGGTWYRQSYQAGTVTYVVVADPTKSK